MRRRNLVQTDTEAGTLSYANPQTVYDRLSGTVTWLPSVGQVIQPGGVLYRVNGEPVLLMNGNTPAYRTLSAADSDGADVLELNRNLKSLGFNADGITADDVWQPGTTLGVELLQESLGETATGSLTLGHVVFLPGPQLISTVQGTLGATDNGGSSGQPASGSADPPAPQFVSLESSSGHDYHDHHVHHDDDHPDHPDHLDHPHHDPVDHRPPTSATASTARDRSPRRWRRCWRCSRPRRPSSGPRPRS